MSDKIEVYITTTPSDTASCKVESRRLYDYDKVVNFFKLLQLLIEGEAE